MLQLPKVRKDKRGSGIRSQRLAGRACGKIDLAQVQWGCADTADAINTNPAAAAHRHFHELREIVEHPSAMFLMHAPDGMEAPAISADALLDCGQAPRFAPGPGQRLEGQAETSCLYRQTLAEFSVDQEQTVCSWLRGQRRGNDLVGQGAAA